MKKITKRCELCEKKFTITYYAKVDDEEATDICSRCWDKKVSSHWQSTRDVLKKNPPVRKHENYSTVLGSYLSNKDKKPKRYAGRYLDNLVPEAQAKKSKKESSKDNKDSLVGSKPQISWLTNHSNGFKEPMLSQNLSNRVEKLLGKLKDA